MPRRPEISPGWLLLAVGLVAWHFILPLRHYAITGDVQFTREASFFSWRVISAETRVPVFAFLDTKSTPYWVFGEMNQRSFAMIGTYPYLLHRFANRLCHRHRKDSIRVEATVEMAGKQGEAYLIDPEVNLCAVTYNHWGHNSWINATFEVGQKMLGDRPRKFAKEKVAEQILRNKERLFYQ